MHGAETTNRMEQVALENNTWKRKEYATWDEAFRGLAPAVRQQSVRVAAYTQALYAEACESSFGTGPAYDKYPDRIKGKYADLAYKCGMYHQIGKALVPQEYQIYQKDFTDEELAVYRKYTTDGRALAASLQEKTQRSREKRRGVLEETATSNVTWLMIRESCEQHMERYDGSGYPKGLVGSAISPIAQIVGLARELDRLSAETKSEEPFAEAYDTLISEAGTAFSPELIDILKAARSKCRAVYNKYIHYTLTLPKTIPLVEKRKGRPMGLTYNPVVSDGEHPIAYEANAWFGGIAGQPGETETAEEVAEQLRRTDLTADVSFYLLYEAADALLRIKNCDLSLDGIIVNMLPGFYSTHNYKERFDALFKDQPVPREGLILTVPQSLVESANKTTLGNIARYMKNGISIMIDGWNPESMPLERCRELGFSHVRIPAAGELTPVTAAVIKNATAQGLTVSASGVDSAETVRCLVDCGVRYVSGPLFGHSVSEDDLIRDSLAAERESRDGI